jgi:hypothetical protein
MAASIIGNLLSGGLLSGISGLINTIRGKSPEDAVKLAELAGKYQSEILAADLQQAQMQADVNKQEASSSSMFVAGWRPAVGWVCAVGLLTQFLVAPLTTWVAALLGKTVVFPTLDMGTLMTLLLGMLGLGGMRTYEKISAAPGSSKVH